MILNVGFNEAASSELGHPSNLFDINFRSQEDILRCVTLCDILYVFKKHLSLRKYLKDLKINGLVDKYY